MVNYNGRRFVSVKSSENGAASKTYFTYKQDDDILSATYSGGDVIKGNMIGIVKSDGSIDFTYSHINQKHEIKTGKCTSTPKTLPDGRIQLFEKWNGFDSQSSEDSIVEEVSDLVYTPQIIFN
ncbi:MULTISPECIES: n-acetylglutamate synthase [Fictibacillus]|uniref:N-acetylglutamate synthase n=1 Tax=Fictibacillus terranigra TaxID=3058424 RepID=A0ABT8E7X1_9BACL|nr:n-acetylglutamate synthase [Fictibacillus sp. CENA-BCM004]MDN4073989.1 n-acetylglutamate synthase [Fictibacillus sp. CENA-BCM004]